MDRRHGDAETAEQFVVFGATASDGLFARWLHDGSTASTTPIVFLGSEGAARTQPRFDNVSVMNIIDQHDDLIVNFKNITIMI